MSLLWTNAEYERLHADHPDWVYLSHEDLQKRYWMYFASEVSQARVMVHRRRLEAAVAKALQRYVKRQ